MKQAPHNPNEDVHLAGFELREGLSLTHHKPQSRLASALEAVVNTLLGMVLAFVTTAVICWLAGIPMTWQSNATLTFWMTVVSLLRTYGVRRAFERYSRLRGKRMLL